MGISTPDTLNISSLAVSLTFGLTGRKVIVEAKPQKEIGESINQAKFKEIEQYAMEKGYAFEV